MYTIYKVVFLWDEDLHMSSYKKAMERIEFLAKDHGYTIASVEKNKFHTRVSFNETSKEAEIYHVQVH